MPAYIVRIAGTNILAGFYAAPSRMHLSLLIDEEVDPSNFECAVIRDGYGIEFRKAGGRVKLIIGDPEASEELEAADYIYLTEDLLSYLTDGDMLRWTPIL
jgi:hypothetical protein